jgi:Periplasmic binding protein
VSFSAARDRGLDVEFGPGCDESTGRVAIPYTLAAECFAEVADNGGATAPGVTADEITVALYVPNPDDPLLQVLGGALGLSDSPEEIEATYRGYGELFESYYQTYGRRARFEVVHASGNTDDEVAARADAVRAAEDLGAFAVWGGPFLTTAWADELAARGVVCLGCNTGGNVAWFTERDPYVYGLTMTGQQQRLMFVDYLTKQVAGRPAEFAADPALQTQTRRFGHIYLETSNDSAAGAENLANDLAEEGIEIVETVAYTLDFARLQEQAASAIARLEAAGVTTVIMQGDPIAPAAFTAEATAQGWFPEWVLNGSALIDTTFFARTYDQRQWANAFGISQLVARGRPELFAPWSLYEWYFGEPPPASGSSTLLFPQPALFYAAVQAAGPELTPETFRDGLFARPPTPDLVTFPSLSFGEHDIWPFVDYSGIDDATELWWDATATGPDEVGNDGTGMYRYTDGGRRHLLGDWPELDTRAFDPDGAVALYDELPPEDRPPDYPPPSG